jgi:cell division protein FtsN
VRALLRLLVLVMVGFGAGLLFGVVTEEPELLAGHLAGESESVSLEEMESDGIDAPDALEARPGDLPSGSAAKVVEEHRQLLEGATPAIESAGRLAARPAASASDSTGSAALPSVAAAPDLGDRSRESRAPVAAPVARTATAPESAMRQIDDRWSIQVGAFSEEGAADRLAEGLRARYPVEVLPASEQGGRWRVRVQPIRGEARAREMAEALKRDERLPTWVTPMEDRVGR